MDAAASQFVRERAGNRCEYCRLPQNFSGVRFHIDHIVPRQHGGTDGPDNLALACPECNYHKGTNLTGVDPDTGHVTPLFDPRRDQWADHFALEEGSLVGKTPLGRTTVWLLEMNRGDRLRLRRLLLRLGLLN
jgi:5-methylcytosine-specific restriction endonuclease McrA